MTTQEANAILMNTSGHTPEEIEAATLIAIAGHAAAGALLNPPTPARPVATTTTSTGNRPALPVPPMPVWQAPQQLPPPPCALDPNNYSNEVCSQLVNEIDAWNQLAREMNRRAFDKAVCEHNYALTVNAGDPSAALPCNIDVLPLPPIPTLPGAAANVQQGSQGAGAATTNNNRPPSSSTTTSSSTSSSGPSSSSSSSSGGASSSSSPSNSNSSSSPSNSNSSNSGSGWTWGGSGSSTSSPDLVATIKQALADVPGWAYLAAAIAALYLMRGKRR